MRAAAASSSVTHHPLTQRPRTNKCARRRFRPTKNLAPRRSRCCAHALLSARELDALEDLRQLLGVDRHAAIARRDRARQSKHAALETLVEDAESTLVPPK